MCGNYGAISDTTVHTSLILCSGQELLRPNQKAARKSLRKALLASAAGVLVLVAALVGVLVVA